MKIFTNEFKTFLKSLKPWGKRKSYPKSLRGKPQGEVFKRDTEREKKKEEMKFYERI